MADLGRPVRESNRVAAVKEKRFVGTQKETCGMDSTVPVLKGTLWNRLLDP
jgi:hypothetical protein